MIPAREEQFWNMLLAFWMYVRESTSTFDKDEQFLKRDVAEVWWFSGKAPKPERFEQPSKAESRLDIDAFSVSVGEMSKRTPVLI